MILELLWLMLGVALVFVIIGLVFDLPIFGIIGFAIIFLCGIAMLLGEIEYNSGSITNVTNTSEVTSYEATKVYTPITGDRSHYFGFLLCGVGVVGFLVVFSIMRTD